MALPSQVSLLPHPCPPALGTATALWAPFPPENSSLGVAAGLCRAQPLPFVPEMWKLHIGENGKHGQALSPRKFWFALRDPPGDDAEAEVLRDEVTEALQMDWVKQGEMGKGDLSPE